MDVRRRVAQNIRRERKAKAWSQEELAFQAGLHRTYISQVERAVRNPTVTALEKIATALGVTTGSLIDGPGE